MSTVAFVGGSLDLTRAAVERVERVQSTYRNPRLSRIAPPRLGFRDVGESYPPSESVSYFEEVYRLYTAYDRAGNEVFVYVFEYDTEPQTVKTEIARLREKVTALSNDKADLTSALNRVDERVVSITDDLREANSRLSAIGNVLSAKEPALEQAGPIDQDKRRMTTRGPRVHTPFRCKLCNPK